jgi:hypothetical protein
MSNTRNMAIIHTSEPHWKSRFDKIVKSVSKIAKTLTVEKNRNKVMKIGILASFVEIARFASSVKLLDGKGKKGLSYLPFFWDEMAGM